MNNAYLQRIFSRTIRFNGKYQDWDAVMLSDILTERKEKSGETEEVYAVFVAKCLANQVERLERSFVAEDKLTLICFIKSGHLLEWEKREKLM